MRSKVLAVGGTITAVLAGGLLVVAYPPFGHGWITLPAVGALLWTLRRAETPTRAVLAGGGFGLAFFGLLFPWIGELGLVAFLPLLITETAFTVLFGAGMWWAQARSFPLWTLTAVGGWALMEWLRARVPFGGFGWGLLGLPAGEYATLRPLTAWIGISGWSLVVVALAATTIWVAMERSGPALGMLGGTVVLVIVSVMAASVAHQNTTGEEIAVAIVQGSWPCPGEHCPDERRLTLDSHLALTRTIEPNTVDLVVWAESSLGFGSDPIENPDVATLIADEARRLNATILAGTDRPVGSDGFINANIVFDPSGGLVGEYRKTHPVPFGEYVPWRQLFGRIPALEQVPRDMVRGPGPVRFDTGFGAFGSVISFEASFARYPRQAVEAGARLLVVATSQNSYPMSRASDQLIGITRMHAAALGVDVVHAAITGRSAIITDGGDIQAISALVERTVIRGTVRMSDGDTTLFGLLGDWVATLAVLALGVGWLGPLRGWRVAVPPSRELPRSP